MELLSLEFGQAPPKHIANPLNGEQKAKINQIIKNKSFYFLQNE